MTVLELNGFESNTDEESLAIVFEQLAEGKFSGQQLARWLEQHATGLKKSPQKAAR